MRRVNPAALLIGLYLAAAPLVEAQTAAHRPPAATPQANEAVGHTATVSRRSARLVLDLSDGSRTTVSLAGGTVSVNQAQVGTYEEGGAFERAVRAVLSQAGSLSTPELVYALRSIPAAGFGPGGSEAMAAIAAALPRVERTSLPSPPDVAALIQAPPDLENIDRMARAAAQEAVTRRVQQATEASFSVGRVATDVAGLFGTLVALASLGFGALFFVPHRLEVVADTVRRSPMRAFFTGLFAQPLLLPALVTLIIGLVLTVVGVLVVPFAVIAFTLAVAAAVVGGYLAVARVVGEIYVRRRGQEGVYTSGWSTYRYLVYGLIGLLAIWTPAVLLRWIPVAGLIMSVAAVAFTWAMATTGFGAAILSRAGRGTAFGPTKGTTLPAEYLWSTPSAAARSTEPRRGGT